MRRLILVFALAAGCRFTIDTAWSQEATYDCLHSVTVGADETPVTSCPEEDPLQLSDNRDLRKAMAALDIDFHDVRFKGCKGQPFSAYPSGNGIRTTYIVTYPADAKNGFLAPVLHELSHVMQMQDAGGLSALRVRYKESRRIELGADYLVGIMFRKLFPDANLKTFEQNILLTGMYVEPNEFAHGTPAERISAFRNGVFGNIDDFGDDMKKISENFQRNIYALVL